MAFNGKARPGRLLAKRLSWLAVGLAVMLLPPIARAHVGSPDVYAEGNAGPYRLLITVRPPLVIPGVAEIEVHTTASGSADAIISNIEIAPIPLTGEGSKHPPVADAMKHSAQDAQFYTGSLWIMASGSWQIRFTVNGNRGRGVLSIPVPATSSLTLGMQAGLGALLCGLGLVLVVGAVGIVGAAARDAQLPAGALPQPAERKRAWIAMGIGLVLAVGAVWGALFWWRSEADNYARYVYKPLTMKATLIPGPTLHLKIEDPGWLPSRKTDDFVLDHDHLMHLYLLREPALDMVYHLHPEQIAPGEFLLALPSIQAGDYRLYADVVHATGFPETLVASVTLSDINGRPLVGDDAKGSAQPLNIGGACSAGSPAESRFHLPDGYTMIWNNAAMLPSKTPEAFEFTLLDPSNELPQDMALYMGMLGHAAFVKTDGTVFAHVHPSGTVSMAALMMAAAQNRSDGAQADSTMSMHIPDDKAPKGSGQPNVVGFPYGFPTPGAYRIFVQMKHGDTIETATFDACAK